MIRLALVLLALGPWALETPRAHAGQDGLFQYSTITALLQGLYDGEMTVGALAEEGDFGLGTLNGLDGEMVALEGVFYQVPIDGRPRVLKADARTPFAAVARFTPDADHALPAGLDYDALTAALDGLIGSGNYPQAIRIDGRFARLKLRSVPAQNQPYPPLAEVVDHQAIFHLEDIEGTLVGFRTPAYLTGVNVPGYHFHFISQNRRRGGHVLGLETADGRIEIDRLTGVDVRLPDSPAFAGAALSDHREKDLKKVEQGD